MTKPKVMPPFPPAADFLKDVDGTPVTTSPKALEDVERIGIKLIAVNQPAMAIANYLRGLYLIELRRERNRADFDGT